MLILHGFIVPRNFPLVGVIQQLSAFPAPCATKFIQEVTAFHPDCALT